jgi:alkanesulfonate monooxygenase SsuD/methylene tetrahydromethanopterin reductase-like flavin-dependent oxidoreductase (luciferase family)
MVCGNTYRNPAFLLKQAITVDHVSGGRVDFGVGAGWVEREHEAYGWELPPAKERVDRFAEALEIWRLLQTQERTTYEGQHYRLLDAPFQPKSLQSDGLPVLIGGSGTRMLRLTARYAQIWNVIGTPEEVATANRRMTEVCLQEGRDPETLVRTVSPSLNLLASVDAFQEGVAAYHAAGMRDIYMPWPRVDAEVPVLRAVARELLPMFQGRTAAGAEDGDVAAVRQLDSVGEDELRAVLAGVDDGLEGTLLRWLIAHPDERFDGAALLERVGGGQHREVTRAFARLGDRFRAHRVTRPWNEAQRGYLITAERAKLLGAVLPPPS